MDSRTVVVGKLVEVARRLFELAGRFAEVPCCIVVAVARIVGIVVEVDIVDRQAVAVVGVAVVYVHQ